MARDDEQSRERARRREFLEHLLDNARTNPWPGSDQLSKLVRAELAKLDAEEAEDAENSSGDDDEVSDVTAESNNNSSAPNAVRE